MTDQPKLVTFRISSSISFSEELRAGEVPRWGYGAYDAGAELLCDETIAKVREEAGLGAIIGPTRHGHE